MPSTFGGTYFGAGPFGGGIAYALYEMEKGPYKGRDPRLVVDEAITWWQQYLDGVDTRARFLRHP